MRLPTALKRLLEQPEERRRLGPFHLVNQLGRGGFAPVWLAREMYGATVIRHAAVKLFALDAGKSTSTGDGPASISSALYRRQIIEEARVLCQVEHPNIVRFYSMAGDEPDGVVGVAMEYLTGTALNDRLTQGTLATAEAMDLGVSIASALAAVHRAGLVHRDVKPANIIDSGGVHKLIDFGITAAGDALRRQETTMPVLVDELPLEVSAATKGHLFGAMTMPGQVSGESSPGMSLTGTMGYVDPECISSGAVPTAASDLYALGVVLFECVVGRHPAATESRQGLDTKVLRGEAPSPPVSELAPDVPPGFARLIDALLSPLRAKRPRSAEWVAIELERLRGEVAGVGRELPPEAIGPFRGLNRFEEDDRDVYFGRSSEIAAAIELLRSHGTVALVGPSGSGKSSLARAGIAPRVAEGALGRWPSAWDAVVTTPTTDPRGAILAALGSLEGLSDFGGSSLEPDQIVARLAERAHATGRGVLLVVDQLEELVTVGTGKSGRWAAQLLGAIGEVPLPGVRALVTARRDLLDALLSLEGVGKALVRGSLLVEPMNETTWVDVVVQALGAYGYALENEALQTQLAEELKNTASAMPLVQFALTELWNKRDRTTKKITWSSLSEIGGIPGSLERHADATVVSLVHKYPGAETIVRDLMLALTTPKGTRATRALSDLERAGDPVRTQILGSLEEARLVVRGAEGVTLAHEALLTQWGRLRTWVAEVREDRLFVEEADRDAERWRAAPDLVPLWKKRRIALADEVRQRRSAAFSSAAEDFLAASHSAERRTRMVFLAASFVALAGVATAGTAYVRAVRQSEQTALEMAAVEGQKAALEQQKRQDLEHAQLELDRRQSQINDLLQKLSGASDEGTMVDVKRQIREAEQGARAARDRIAATIPAKKATTTAVEPPVTAASVAQPNPTPTVKIQREDP